MSNMVQLVLTSLISHMPTWRFCGYSTYLYLRWNGYVQCVVRLKWSYCANSFLCPETRAFQNDSAHNEFGSRASPGPAGRYLQRSPRPPSCVYGKGYGEEERNGRDRREMKREEIWKRWKGQLLSNSWILMWWCVYTVDIKRVKKMGCEAPRSHWVGWTSAFTNHRFIIWVLRWHAACVGRVDP